MNRPRPTVGAFLRQDRQGGYVLVSGLILLLVLTLVAVTSMQSAGLEYRMSANLVYRDRAFQSSESGRRAVAEVLDKHVYDRGWTAQNRLPMGLQALDKDGSGAADDLYIGNDDEPGAVPENLMDHSTLLVDITYRINNNAAEEGQADHDDGGDIAADIAVYRLGFDHGAGAGAAMAAGYLGLGRAVAAGGNLYFELRSTGRSAGGAQVVTVSEFRAPAR